MARVVIDAGVLIALYNDNDLHHRWAVDFLIQSTNSELHMSSLNLAEVIVQPIRQGVLEKLISGIKGLGVELTGVSQEAAIALAGLRATTNLPMPDCCLIALAQDKKASLATTDKGAAKAARALGLDVYQP